MAYSKETHIKAKQEIQSKRKKALLEREKHHEEAVHRCPEILEIEERMAKTGLATIKAVGMKNEDSKKYIENLAKINMEAQQQRALLLKSAGFPVDYLDIKYNCKKCEDTGSVNGFVCECYKNLLRSIEYEKLCSKLPVDKCRFDNFRLDYYDDGPGTSPRVRMKSVFEYCKTYADDFGKTSPSLLLYGQTGLGKTHLSLAVAGKVVEAGYGVIYSSAQNLFSRLEDDKFGRTSNNTEFSIIECDLLIIDDLGAEFNSPFAISALYNIVNSRELEEKPTIISTNLTIEGIKKIYSDRISSRILSNYVKLFFDGTDIRQKKMR